MIRSALFLAFFTLSSAAFAQKVSAPAEPPASLKVEFDLVYGKTPEQELKLDVYRPKNDTVLPACVLVHGGGWISGDKERFRALGFALAEKGYVVANVEYRLAGAAKYPAAVQDCSLAVRWVRANAKRFALDPQRIGAWGGSAGGHLVGLLAAVPEHFLTADLKDVSAAVQATCIMAGPTDLTNATFVESLRKSKEKSNSYTWFGKLYDAAPELYRDASPLTHFTKTTGPILFLTGDLDNPARDQAGIEKLQSLGVPTKQTLLKDAKHGCWMQKPWFDQCVTAVDGWFKEHLK
ncbi:MAG: alpha/beta hydrolase [Verrucomicrobiaceae bacterium]